MALDYSKPFYNSKKWKDLRLYVCESRHWTCEECGEYGDQVHHIIEITPSNINDPNITLNEDNLQLLCEECHNAKRRQERDIEDGLRFDENGNLVKYPLLMMKNNSRKYRRPHFKKLKINPLM